MATLSSSYNGVDLQPCRKRGKGREERHIDSNVKSLKSRESPSPEDGRGVNMDQMGFWQHAAPGLQCLC
eukprot:1141772-Pelagomonas_calceolata.AAC.2